MVHGWWGWALPYGLPDLLSGMSMSVAPYRRMADAIICAVSTGILTMCLSHCISAAATGSLSNTNMFIVLLLGVGVFTTFR